MLIQQDSEEFSLEQIALVAYKLHSRKWSSRFQISGSIMCLKLITNMLTY